MRAVMYLKGMRDYWRGDLPQALQTLEEAAQKPDAGLKSSLLSAIFVFEMVKRPEP